ncbi:hypothetical protein CEXT_294571 [Caerostris extrusa]|uniref:Uncharacterized protein n=1 Tax=Caerostris extrusa TaxID=172846 RepID=A0AAV4RQR4_CAEEX|nr:hypothetical protein CEXT_294571 [Caerostris extrusa]
MSKNLRSGCGGKKRVGENKSQSQASFPRGTNSSTDKKEKHAERIHAEDRGETPGRSRSRSRYYLRSFNLPSK